MTPPIAPIKEPRVAPWLILAAVAAVAARLAHLCWPVMDADMAIVGLMGLDVARGDIPLLFWGQDYGGGVEALVAGALFWLFGASRFTLNLAPALISGVYLAGVYRAGRLLGGARLGLWALGLAAVGPYYLTWHSVLARAINIEYLAASTWLVALGLDILASQPGSRRHRRWCLAWGLVAGLGIWCHFLTLYTLIPCGLVLWRADPRWPLRAGFWLAALGFLVGSAPLLAYNLIHPGATWDYLVHYPRPVVGWREGVDFLWRQALPELLGLGLAPRPAWLAIWLVPVGAALAVAGGLGALAAWTGQAARRLISGRADGGDLPWAVLLGTLAIFIILGAASGHTSRYLLSLYAVWPLALAWTAQRLWTRGGWARGLGMAGWLLVAGFHLWGSLITSPALDPALRQAHRDEMAQIQRTVDACRELGLTHVWTPDYWRAPVRTFAAQEAIVFAGPYQERQPRYYRAALRDAHAGILVGDAFLPQTRSTLAGLGATWRELDLGREVLCHHFQAPSQATRLLDPDEIVARADPRPQLAPAVLDGAATTRWSPHTGQRPGQTLTLDLGRAVEGVCQVLLFSGMFQDHPAQLTVAGSLDGATWTDLATVLGTRQPWCWDAGRPVSLGATPWQEVRFAPRTLRFLRLTQTARGGDWWWSILEARVGVAAPGADPPDPEAAARWLAGRGLQGPVHAGPTLTAWLPAALRPAFPWRPRPDWLREYLAPELLLSAGPVNLVVELPWLPLARQALAAAGWSVRESRAHGYALLQAAPPAERPAPPSTRADLTPEVRGHDLVWDLGQELEPARLEIRGGRDYLAGTGLGLWLSADGREWRPARHTPSRPGPLYWAGLAPLAARDWPLRLDLAPGQRARWLRLSTPAEPPDGLIAALWTQGALEP